MHYQIHLQPADTVFTAGPDETLLAAALRQGAILPYGCRNGLCGSCAARVTEGTVHYPHGTPARLEHLPPDSCLTCQAVAATDLQLRIDIPEPTAAPVEIRTLPCRVAQMEQLSHDVMRLWLKLPARQTLDFRPGQYLEFLLRNGQSRAFSIANVPDEDGLLELHIRRIPGGSFTEYVFSALQERTILRIRGPLGSFCLREDSSRPILMLAGGTGFAPLKAMLEHAVRLRMTRPIHLYRGARTREDLYLPGITASWEQALEDFHCTPVLSGPDADWPGRRGFVHEAALEDFPDPSGFDLYMSGPPAMIEAASTACMQRGLAAEHILADAFVHANAESFAERG